MPPTTVTSVGRFQNNHVESATRALFCLATLTFDLGGQVLVDDMVLRAPSVTSVY